MIRTLLQTELYKLFKARKTWYALAAVLIIEAIILTTAYYQGTTILELLLDNLRQSFYFEGNLLNGNLLIYIILNSLWFNLPLILMIVTSSVVTDEYKHGTLQTVMLQAVNKREFIIAKYLAALSFTLLVILLMVLSTGILAYSIFGTGDLVVYLDMLNLFPAEEAYKRIGLAFASGSLSMMFYTCVSLSLGIVIKEPATTWIASSFFLILCSLLLKLEPGIGLWELLFFPKLTNNWLHFFEYELLWENIVMENSLLLMYILLSAGLGVYFFSKSDIE